MIVRYSFLIFILTSVLAKTHTSRDTDRTILDQRRAHYKYLCMSNTHLLHKHTICPAINTIYTDTHTPIEQRQSSEKNRVFLKLLRVRCLLLFCLILFVQLLPFLIHIKNRQCHRWLIKVLLLLFFVIVDFFTYSVNSTSQYTCAIPVDGGETFFLLSFPI